MRSGRSRIHGSDALLAAGLTRDGRNLGEALVWRGRDFNELSKTFKRRAATGPAPFAECLRESPRVLRTPLPAPIALNAPAIPRTESRSAGEHQWPAGPSRRTGD